MGLNNTSLKKQMAKCYFTAPIFFAIIANDYFSMPVIVSDFPHPQAMMNSKKNNM